MDNKDVSSEKVAFRFPSEPEFDKAVDRLYSSQQPYDVFGFNVLVVPVESAAKIEALLQSAEFKFDRIAVTSTADLTDRERAVVRKELSSVDDDKIAAA